MIALLRKELKTYFLTPSGWTVLAVFLLVSGILYALQLVFQQSPEYSNYLAGLLFLFLLVIPLLTMRIFTDERRFQTDQLLLTAPTGLWNIVLGKYLAALIVFLIIVGVSVLYPVLLNFHGRLEWSMIIGTYMGFILIGAAFISIGVYVSQVAEGVVGAAVLTFCALIITFIIDFLRPYMPTTGFSGLVWAVILAAIPLLRLYLAGRNWRITLLVGLVLVVAVLVTWFLKQDIFIGLIGKSLGWLSLTRRFSSFAMGILKLNAVVYYFSFIGFALFLTVQSLEKRRWS